MEVKIMQKTTYDFSNAEKKLKLHMHWEAS